MKSKRNWLEESELDRLMNYQPDYGTTKIQHDTATKRRKALRIFPSSYFCSGIRFVNILFMEKTAVVGNRIHWINAKGNKPADMEIPEQLREIIDRNMHGEGDYLFIKNPKKQDPM